MTLRRPAVLVRVTAWLFAATLAGLVGPPVASASAPPAVRHVFVIILENESVGTTFGPASPAPYLSQTLVSEGAYDPNYFGIGHASLDNYIAMVSGQAPNPMTSGDCPIFADFPAGTTLTSTGQINGEGCVSPATVPSLMSQLDKAGLRWRAYEDGMGADPTRESVTCGHPNVGAPDNTEAATRTDQYATRHDPFVYFHYVIDNQAGCNADVVNLNELPADLQSASTTPNYAFITPNLCDDGHDARCANGGPGGLTQANAFLQTWVPMITSSPAFKQNGLLIVTFDEAVDDSTACCGEMPGPFDAANHIMPGGTGPGGGAVGAVLLSPFISPGTRSSESYNHYSMLGTVEDIFGLPRLADAVGVTAFGDDVFTRLVKMSISVKSGFKSKHGLARVTRLTLFNVPAGASVFLTCSGGKSRGCAWKSRRARVTSSTVVLTSLLKRLHLSRGAGLNISITAPGYKPVTLRYKVNKHARLGRAR
jgi:hypothetical protein